MSLCDHITIARRFQRSVRIDTDLCTSEALAGFICTRSSSELLLSMANHIKETEQGAFTWTGPYGSGKSSLVIVLSALLSADPKIKRTVSHIVSSEVTSEIQHILPTGTKGWKILPVVGRREQPYKVFGEGLETLGVHPPKGKSWTENSVLETIASLANSDEHGGLIVFVDEMGKFLEAASYDNSDIYIFQQLAEIASRSKRKLLIVGILHQSFAEYASRLSRDMRDEWAKIQGRFVDLPVNTAGEEQIELIARAIINNTPRQDISLVSSRVADLIFRSKPSASKNLGGIFEDCFPLHPVVVCLLGPLSRRRFGQNQRSIFGFLNSGEPQGFQDFLHNAKGETLFEPDRLWDYLRINLEPAILSSPDGHRWALAVEAIERLEVSGGADLELRVLKVIALVDLFKERSGLLPTDDLLCCCFANIDDNTIKDSLKKLKTQSYIIFRSITASYCIYAGSDFDIDEAVQTALEEIQGVDFVELRQLAGIQPVLSKRYYHTKGSLYWFDVDVVPLKDLEINAVGFSPRSDVIGRFLLVIPTEGETRSEVDSLCRRVAQQKYDWDIIIGSSPRTWAITSLAKELLATEKVLHERVELGGDAVARREVLARLAALQGKLETELNQAFVKAMWYIGDNNPQELQFSELNTLASSCAEKRFPKAPCIFNELLNRIRPSANAIAAQNALLRHMVMNEGAKLLGISGYPPERGLFASLFERTNLYKLVDNKWSFASPTPGDDPANLYPMWDAACTLLKTNSDRSVPVSELYSLWKGENFGIKDGLLPILSVAFIHTQQHNLAYYRQGIFLPRLRDIDVEYLAKDASEIQLRWMDLSETSRTLLSEMACTVRRYDSSNELRNLEAIDVARGLIAIYARLQPWVQRTMRLSKNAIQIRTLFKGANDPNKFLFNDIAGLAARASCTNLDGITGIETVVSSVKDGLDELTQAYPRLLLQLQDTLFSELHVPNNSSHALDELRNRAENVKQTTGEFRVEALIGRLAIYTGAETDIEGIASLAVNKPVRDWIDTDIDKAVLELSDLAQQFLRAEAFARVKGRPANRHSIAVVVGINGRPTPARKEFEITEADKGDVLAVVAMMQKLLDKQSKSSDIVIAALAELSARYIEGK